MGTLRDELAKQLGLTEAETKAAEAKAATDKRDAAQQQAASAHQAATPRYLDAEFLSLTQAEAFMDTIAQPPANPKVDGVFDPVTFSLPSVQRIGHSVEVDELHLPAEGSHLIIDGDLRVANILKQDFRAGALLVTGDLYAGHIVTTGQIACVGNLHVGGALYGNCTNYCTNVWGKTTAEVVISAKEHYFCFWGGHDIGVIIDVYGDTPNLDDRDHDESSMGQVLLPEVGDAFDDNAVWEVLRTHGTLLRPR